MRSSAKIISFLPLVDRPQTPECDINRTNDMSFGAKIWIGADPSGMGNFGLAILKSDGPVHTCCVNCADEAIDVVKEQVKVRPAGVGVDSPLWWSSGRSSDRKADQWLRDTYGLSGGQVQTANSLRGAALVQGAMFVSGA
jgi:hypothetical protein